MAKQDIINYVMNTPGNTNKMVLEGMLEDTNGVKLPEINEEDEGKVLTVIDGKWDKGTASGGGTEPLIVNATTSMYLPDPSPSSHGGTDAHIIAVDDAVTIDASYDDIKQAFDSGNEVVVHLIFTNVLGSGYEVLRLSTYASPVASLFPRTIQFFAAMRSYGRR